MSEPNDKRPISKEGTNSKAGAAGQAPWFLEALARLQAQRGHAWLLTGMKGLRQFELAMALAASWLCEGGARLSCGHCDACHMIAAKTHPDLMVLLPETLSIELGWSLDEKTQNDIDDKKRKPSKQIKTEAVQNLIGFVQRTSARGKGLAVVIYPPEAMNHVSANALLKSLEEPAGDTRFLLATEDAHALLPTIRSRCQMLRINPETSVSLVPWQSLPTLIARGAMPSELPDAVIETPLALAQNLQKLCHDWLCVGQGAEPRFYDAGTLLASAPHIAQEQTRQTALYKLTSWSQQLNTAVRAAEHTLNANLMIESLLAQAKQAVALRG